MPSRHQNSWPEFSSPGFMRVIIPSNGVVLGQRRDRHRVQTNEDLATPV
jgi:hypothetical protein